MCGVKRGMVNEWFLFMNFCLSIDAVSTNLTLSTLGTLYGIQESD